MTTSKEEPHIVAFTTIEGGFWIPWKPQWKAPPESVLDHMKLEIKTVNEVMGEPPPGCDQSLGETLLAKLHVGDRDLVESLGKHCGDWHRNIPEDSKPWVCSNDEQQLWVHALKFSDGREWDALNGWRDDPIWKREGYVDPYDRHRSKAAL